LGVEWVASNLPTQLRRMADALEAQQQGRLYLQTPDGGRMVLNAT
jgi:hypothetical protein